MFEYCTVTVSLNRVRAKSVAELGIRARRMFLRVVRGDGRLYVIPFFDYTGCQQSAIVHIRLSRFKLARPPTPRDAEVSNASAIIHDSLGPVCICSLRACLKSIRQQAV